MNEAHIRYLKSDFQILSPGTFVKCSVTNAKIALEDLKYWNVTLQEAYVDAGTSYRRQQKIQEKISNS